MLWNGDSAVEREFLYSAAHNISPDLALTAKLIEGADRYRFRIDFEMASESLSGIAHSETVSTKRCETVRHPAGDHVGERLHIIAYSNDRPLRCFENSCDIRLSRLLF